MEVPSLEGLERPLRERVSHYLLQERLDWPQRLIRSGESYDILCYDEDLIPVLYIETKSPLSAVPQSEVDKALDRARNLTVLQYVLITNGKVYRLYDLGRPTSPQLLNVTEELSAEEAGQFFEPLKAARFQTGRTWASTHRRLKVTKETAKKELAEGLRQVVERLREPLQRLIGRFFTGEINCEFAKAAFRDWQQFSLRIPDDEIEKELEVSARIVMNFAGAERERAFVEQVERLQRLLAIPHGQVQRALTMTISGMEAAGVVDATVSYQLLGARNDIELFCVQTAHVILGRLLLYRVAEDKELLPRTISGQQVETRLQSLSAPGLLHTVPEPFFVDLYLSTRRYMVDVDPGLYRFTLYDWWVMESTARETLTPHEQRQYLQSYRELNRAIKSTLHLLNLYDFRDVESDIWREVYQHYLPKEERLRLGGFYTDDELAKLLLELAGYTGEDLLDPACGSGTFLVEAVPYIRSRIEQQSKTRSRSAKAREVLEAISSHIKGIDIHPFAVFLTQMNLFFLTLDLFQSVRNADPSYTYHFQVYEADYLERAASERLMQLRMSLFVQNSRAKETLERWAQAEAVKSQAFGMVVGNPPWGGVLRPGRPLAKGLAGGGSKSRDYAKDYASARGKYDIYVLFLERGMEQVKPKGSLAFVTQNRYLSREYGAVIRKLLVQKREDEVRAVELIADLGEVGGMFFFPEQTNYPCLTVVRKADLPRAKLIRVETDGTFPVNPEAKHSFVESLKRVYSRLDTEDKASEEPMSGVLVRGLAVDQALLRRWADEGVPWDLTRCESAVVPRIRKTRATVPTVPLVKAFIVQQGATTGRADRILLIPQEVVHRHQLEEAVLRKVIRGRDISPFRIDWSGLVAVYPYDTQGKVMNLGKGIWESDATRAKERIEEEIALGHVIAPRSSLYLAQFYGELANRMFEGKSIRELGKEWFEWHRSRKPELVVTAPKIVSRRQIHEASFAVDAEGYLLMDSCIALVPHRNSDAWASLVEYFRSILDREPKESEILRFAVAILNHPVSDSRLKQGGTPQRGNYYTIGGEHLGRFSIRLPTTVKAKGVAHRLAMGKEDDASPFLS
jgi:hypothetical protein